MSKRVYAKAETVRVLDRWDEEAEASLQLLASPKAIVSRVRTNPRGYFKRVKYVVRHEGNELTEVIVNCEDFDAESPFFVGTEEMMFVFSTRGSIPCTSFTVKISFATGSIKIFGTIEAIGYLTDWLHVPFTDFKLVRYR
jgi:hypothetical protein